MFLEYFLWLSDFFRCTPKAYVTIREYIGTTLNKFCYTCFLELLLLELLGTFNLPTFYQVYFKNSTMKDILLVKREKIPAV